MGRRDDRLVPFTFVLGVSWSFFGISEKRNAAMKCKCLMFIAVLMVSCRAYCDAVDDWSQALAQAFGHLQSAASQDVRILQQTAKLAKHIPPVAMEVDVTGLKELVLVADDAGDGICGDHCVWASPELTTLDGKTVSGMSLKPSFNFVQWSRLGVNKNFRGEPLTIAGKVYKEGWWVHANSVVHLPLDGKYKRFKVLVGTDKRADCPLQKVRFTLYAGRPISSWKHLLLKDLCERFVSFERRLAEDISGGHSGLLNGYASPCKAMGQVIRSRCSKMEGLKDESLKRLAELESKNADLPAYCRYYHELLGQAQAMKDVTGALDLLIRTHEFVGKATRLEGYSEKIEALRKRAGISLNQSGMDWSGLLAEIRALRREILFLHPQLAFKDLLINKAPPTRYSHQCDQYLGRWSRPGAGLVVLKDWKSAKPQEVELLTGKLPTGSVAHPDLSYDGKRILFSYCDHSVKEPAKRRFLIWEIGVDGTGLRQITGTEQDAFTRMDNRNTVLIEDFDPCYLPDGGIAFISTRCQSFGRCHGARYTPAYFLYRMNGDGTGIRALSYGEANEWDPSVLPDGRIIYGRWDYINRHDTVYQSLWTMRPDGTGTAHYYGNYTRNPCMQTEAHGIPGTNKVVALAMAHHSYTAGSIIMIDPSKGEDGPEPLTRLTPETSFPETEGWPEKPYTSPYPLSEDFVFAAVSNERLVSQGKIQSANAYGIVLIDSLGGREEIYRDPTVSCVSPLPIRPRPMPPVLCSTLPGDVVDKDGNLSKRPGVVYVQDATMSRVKISSKVRSIRLNSIICQPTCRVPGRSVAENEIVKRVEGTVPVREDGSAYFTMPSGKPIQLQALDENGMAVMTMRSFIYVQPGETLSCVGCHENKAQIIAPGRLSLGKIDKVTPLKGQEYEGGFSFMRSVQPVLDKHCISCHGFGKATQVLDLRGTMKQRSSSWTAFSESYQNLVNRPGMIRLLQRNKETATSVEKDYFSHAGKLGKKLLSGHCPSLNADKESFALFMTWLDLNVQYFGDYAFDREEGRSIDPAGEKALREAIRARFGDELAQQPFDTLVNAAAPEKSRILLMGLPVSEGGWGQMKQNGFSGRDDASWKALRALIDWSLKPVYDRHAEDGTCGRKKCICGVCWVRQAQNENRSVDVKGK